VERKLRSDAHQVGEQVKLLVWHELEAVWQRRSVESLQKFMNAVESAARAKRQAERELMYEEAGRPGHAMLSAQLGEAEDRQVTFTTKYWWLIDLGICIAACRADTCERTRDPD
jgi:hypothetical protein